MAPPVTNTVTRFEGKDNKWFETALKGNPQKDEILKEVGKRLRFDPNGNPTKIDSGIETIAVANLFITKYPNALKTPALGKDLDAYLDQIRPKRIHDLLVGVKQLGDTVKAIKTDLETKPLYEAFAKLVKQQAETNDAAYIKDDQIKDDTFKGDYLHWFLTDLTQSALVLYQLGDKEYGDRYLTLAETATDNLLKMSPLAISIANMSAKYVLANWKDNKSPFEFLSKEIDTYMLSNAARIDSTINDLARRDPTELAQNTSALALVLASETINQKGIAKPDKEVKTPSLNVVPLVDGKYNASVDDYISAVSYNFALSGGDRGIERFLNENLAGLPLGDAYLLGGGDGREARQIASNPTKILKVYNLEQSALSVDRTNRMAQRMRGILSLAPIDGVKTDVVDYNYPTQSASLVTANHVIEFIPPDRRKILFGKLATALKDGGKIFISIHLREGEKYESFKTILGSNFKVVPKEEAKEEGTVDFSEKLENGKTLNRRKHFFEGGELSIELARYNLTPQNGFKVETIPLGKAEGGFNTEQVIITKITPVKTPEKQETPKAQENNNHWYNTLPWNWRSKGVL